MARQEYQRRLDELGADVRSMANLVLERYDAALEAFESGDEALARSVIEGDHEVNERYLDLEGDCIDLLALQQPVAGDLRFVASSFKIITDLERVGDLATNLASYGAEGDSPPRSADRLRDLGDTAGSMLDEAMDAYEAGDAAATWEIAANDDDLDRACQRESERVVMELLSADDAAASDQERLDDASRSLLTIRDVERVGDHAVNVCARTLYMVENDDGLIY